jgi:hypothetical protein
VCDFTRELKAIEAPRGKRLRWLTSFGHWRVFQLRSHCRGVFDFELIGAFLAEPLVEPHGIVKHFGVLEHAQPRRFQTFECFMLGPCVFE